MKKLLTLSTLALLLFSCTSDDGIEMNNNNYFPATENATWQYDYEGYEPTEGNGTFTTAIRGTSTIDGQTYQVLDNTTYLDPPYEKYYFRKPSSNKVVLRPVINMFGAEMILDEINLLVGEIRPEEIIGETSNTIEGEPFPIPANTSGITGTVTPTTKIILRNRQNEGSERMIVNSTYYEDIAVQTLMYRVQLNLQIDATANVAGQSININENHELISEQRFGIQFLYFAKDIGIVRAEYTFSTEDLELNTELNLNGIPLDLNVVAPDMISNFNNLFNVSRSVYISDYSLE